MAQPHLNVTEDLHILTIPHWNEERHQDKRLLILYEAEQLFARNGFQKTDLVKVAEKAAVSKATIYKFFKNKDELLLTIVRKNFNYLIRLGMVNLMAEGDAVTRTYRICYAIADFLENNREFCEVLVQDAGRLMEEIQVMYRSILFDNATVLESLFENLNIPSRTPHMDTRSILKVIMNVSIGVIYTWVVLGETTLRKEVDFYLGLYFSKQDRLPEISNAKSKATD